MIFTPTNNQSAQKIQRRIASVVFAVVVAVNVFGPFASVAEAQVPKIVPTKTFDAYMAEARSAVQQAQDAAAQASKPETTDAQALTLQKTAEKAQLDVTTALAYAAAAGGLIQDPVERSKAQDTLTKANGQNPNSTDPNSSLKIKANVARETATLAAVDKAQSAAAKQAVQEAGGLGGRNTIATAVQTKSATPSTSLKPREQGPKHPLELCGITGNNTISMCVAGIFYVFFVDLTSPIAYLAGAVFDAFAGLSLQSGTYASAVIAKGWVIARDIANMAFVFILIYMAIMMILNLEGVSAARHIATIIAVALLINFSFFFSRVIIDGSNILAHAFYDNIVAAQGPTSESLLVSGTKLAGNAVAGVADTNSDIKSISEKVMAGINPQDLMGNRQFQEMISGGARGASTFFDNLAILLTLFFIFGIINIILAFVFLTAAFQFLTRIVALWFAIILSPIAFIALVLPPAKKVWGQWLNLIISNAFYAPAFMFVIYITIKMLDNGLLSNDIASFLADSGASQVGAASGGITSFLNRIVGVVMRLSVVVGLLIAALKVGTFMGVQSAKTAQSWAGKIAVGGNAAAVGWAARNSVGLAGNALARSSTVRDLASSGGRLGSAGILLGRALEKTGNGLATTSFDGRASISGGSVGGKAQSGGYRKAIDTRAKAIAHDEHERHDTDEEKLKKEKDFKKQINYDAQKTAINAKTDEQMQQESAAAQRQLTQATQNFVRAETDAAHALEYGTQQERAAAEENKLQARGSLNAAQTNRTEAGKSRAERIKDLDKKVSDAVGKEDSDRKKATVASLESRNVRNLWGFSSSATDRAAYNISHGKSKDKKLADAVKDYVGGEAPAAPAPAPAAPAGGGGGAAPAPAAPAGGGGGDHH